jgi:N-acetylmuramoyl-L-alanine amidase
VVVELLPPATETIAAPPPAPPGPPAPPVMPPADPPAFGQPPSAIRTVTIDPGHGGADEGARGAQGLLEKNLTLIVARRVRALLEARLGLRVLLTRDDDRNVAFDDRAAVANNNKADLFISLHANASLKPGATGASIVMAAFPDEARTRQQLVPERVPVFGGGSRDIEMVLWNQAQIRYIDQSAVFMRTLQEQLEGRVPLDIRPTGRAPLRVLASANMPAVLVELGYLSNPEQERQLAAAELQTTVAQAILDAVVLFRDYLAHGAGVER